VTTFGKTLRSFRQASNDPDRLNKRLTQERLGELIGHEMEDLGFTGAAISDWERGESKINAQDRNVLVALVQVLQRCEGLQTLEEANQLLEAGNYRALDPNEIQNIFGERLPDSKTENAISKSSIRFLAEDFFAVSEEELQAIIMDAREGPPPSWPRILAAFMRRVIDRFSISISTIIWGWIWVITILLIGPSLRWPFASQDSALLGIEKYVCGTLIIPLFIGSLTNTNNNEYWKQQSVSPFLLRLYTHQGAGIGFNLGYFFVLPFNLACYYLHLESTLWLEITAATLGLILGNISARVVPHNLWRAYGRLTFKDGWIFFVVALIGPLWGVFFLAYYSVLLTPILGVFVIMSAVTLIVIITARQSNNKANEDESSLKA